MESDEVEGEKGIELNEEFSTLMLNDLRFYRVIW
jgi:hypothetical protein